MSYARENETLWGLRFTPFVSALYNLEEFVDDESYRRGSQEFNFSYALGGFAERRVSRYVAVGGDLDVLFLNPKVRVSRDGIKMLSLGPSIRLAAPVHDFDLYLRAAAAFSVAFLPDDLTERAMINTNGTTGYGKYESRALGYTVKVGPGVSYRTEHIAFFVTLTAELGTVYTKLIWSNGLEQDMTVSPRLFGVDLGAAFVP